MVKPELEQDFGDPAHADAPDPDEVQVLGLEKHLSHANPASKKQFAMLLFRLPPPVSIKIVGGWASARAGLQPRSPHFLQNPRRALGRSRPREA